MGEPGKGLSSKNLGLAWAWGAFYNFFPFPCSPGSRHFLHPQPISCLNLWTALLSPGLSALPASLAFHTKRKHTVYRLKTYNPTAWRVKGYQVEGRCVSSASCSWRYLGRLKSGWDQTPMFLFRWPRHQRGAFSCSSHESERSLLRSRGWCSLSSLERLPGPAHWFPVFACSRVNEYGRLWFPLQDCFNWQRWSGEDVPSPTIHSGKEIWNSGLVCWSHLSPSENLWMGDWAQCWPLGCRFSRHPS